MSDYAKLPLGGKDRGFKFDIKTVGAVIGSLDITVNDLSDEMTGNPFKTYPVIIIEGLKRNAEKAKTTAPDDDEVLEWIEDDGLLSENVLAIIKAFSESIVSLLPQAEKPVPNGKAKPKK